MTRNITFRDLRQYLNGMGFTELTEPIRFRFDHPPSGSVVILRRYLPGQMVSEFDLATVHKTLVERGVLEEASFEDFLQKTVVIGQDELDHLYRVFFAVCELGEAIKGVPITSTHSPWLPYDAGFHLNGALDDLMRYLELTGQPLEDWSAKFDLKSGSRQAKSTLRKIAKAIHPLLFQPGCDQAQAKEQAFDLLGQAAMDLKEEIEKKEMEKGTNAMGDWAPELRRIWPRLPALQTDRRGLHRALPS